MNSFAKYISGIYIGVKSLLGGMVVTWKELWTKKVTMQYPENRETLVISPNWRATLIMPHDENNEHACTSCSICETNCPNGTITVIPKMIDIGDGKQKKVLDKHIWNNGMCTFCNLCVITCPSDAIIFTNEFENAVFDRSKLIQQINKEGSKLREKKKEPIAPKVEAPKAETATPKVEAPKAETATPKVEAPKAEAVAPKTEAPEAKESNEISNEKPAN